MDIEWKLFADLREVADGRVVTVSVDDGATVGDALEALLTRHDALRERILDDSGTVRGDINILRNGQNVFTQEQRELETPVDGDDELAVFPPVSGG